MQGQPVFIGQGRGSGSTVVPQRLRLLVRNRVPGIGQQPTPERRAAGLLGLPVDAYKPLQGGIGLCLGDSS